MYLYVLEAFDVSNVVGEVRCVTVEVNAFNEDEAITKAKTMITRSYYRVVAVSEEV